MRSAIAGESPFSRARFRTFSKIMRSRSPSKTLLFSCLFSSAIASEAANLCAKSAMISSSMRSISARKFFRVLTLHIVPKKFPKHNSCEKKCEMKQFKCLFGKMPFEFWLTLAVFVGYFFESIFGIAGTILWLSFLGFFVDIKELIFLTILTGISASLFIILSDLRNVSLAKFGKMILWAAPGVFVGSAFVQILSSEILLQFFALFLIGFSLYLLFESKFSPSSFFRKIFLVCSGFMQGLFSTGGPFAVVATTGNFWKNKSEFRVTLSVFFIAMHILRIIQYAAQKTFDFSRYFDFWYLPIVIFVAVFLGHRVHIKISESLFRKGLSILLLLCGLAFLLV